MALGKVLDQECSFKVMCCRCGYWGCIDEFVHWRVSDDQHGTIVEVYVKCPKCGAEHTVDADYVDEE